MATLTQEIMLGVSWDSGTLTSGAAVVVQMEGAPKPATITANPASGDSVKVEFSVDDGVTYAPWYLEGDTDISGGVVTVRKTLVLISSVTHLRFTRTAGSGTASTWSIC